MSISEIINKRNIQILWRKTMIEIENADNRDFMIHHHLGTGDHFICNGLVNYICSEIEKETEK